MSVIYEREMTITHKEFLRLLPKALNGLSYQQDENQILVKDGDGLICIFSGGILNLAITSNTVSPSFISMLVALSLASAGRYSPRLAKSLKINFIATGKSPLN